MTGYNPAARIRIAVVIACHNRRESTLRALAALYSQQTADLEIDVRLLDDASSDGTAAAVAMQFPQVTLISGDGQRFWGGGMYDAMSSVGTANYDYMLWLNDDVTLQDGALTELVKVHDDLISETGSRLNVVVGSLLNPLTGTVYYTGMRRTSSWHPSKIERIMPDPDQPVPCDTMNGNCVLVPIEVVTRVGFIDPMYVQQLGDIDYGYRVREAGAGLWIAPRPVGTCVYEPRAKPWQAPGLTIRQRLHRLNSPLGLPMRPWMRFMWRYGGPLGVGAMLFSYAKTLAQSVRPSRLRRVVFITAILTHYRVGFHERVRATLAAAGVTYDLVYSAPRGAEAAKQDTIDLTWAIRRPARYWLGGRAVWQSIWPVMRKADLVVLGQENRFLHNYLVQLVPRAFRPRIGFWGHGRNFQARNPNSRAERWKRFWAIRVHWWFAYTEETRRHVESLGFPADRITVFDNAVDTTELSQLAAAITPSRQYERRHELGLMGRNVAIFVGGLYSDKRLDYLIDAAVRVRARVPDFELIVAGGGSELGRLRALAVPHSWIKVVGPRFGADKAELMSIACIFLMPGLLGLAILDAAVMGLPTITTAFPWHSPEIAYLQPGVNGLIVDEWEDVDAYALVVSELLGDHERLAAMAAAARATAGRLSIEAMANQFVDGVFRALA